MAEGTTILSASDDYPLLERHHLQDAKLYADRYDMVRGLNICIGGKVAEVGVAAGWFSQFLIDTLQPAEFVAIDRFDMHTMPRLSQYADDTFDMIYIDAGHTYEDVKRDTEIAATKVKRDGVLIFNDYIITDHLYATRYGVVQAVNELVTSTSWKVVGFALERLMFCDIALRWAAA